MTRSLLPGTGVILAGGYATRMGSDKSLLSWRDGTLLSHVAHIVSATMEETLVIGGDPEAHPIDATAARFLNDPEKLGPLGALRLGLKSARHPRILLVACDMPFITPHAIRFLWRASAGNDVTLPRSTEGLHPLFSINDRACIPFIEASLAKGERKVLLFYENVRMAQMPTTRHSAYWNRILTNLNTPEEYRQALVADRPEKPRKP